jgi:hypothetical protein
VGAVALRDVKVGECLIDEAPLFTQNNRAPWFQPSEAFAEAAVERAVARLAPAEQASFYALHGYTGGALHTLPPTALQIYTTNAYPAGPDRSGLFPAISRLNSHCAPNAHYHFDERRGRGTVHAIAPIQQGDEVVNCYVGLFLPRAERRAYLQRHFGFLCTCAVCEPSMDSDSEALLHVEESDRRRSTLATLERETAAALLGRHRDEALALVARRTQLLEAEGIAGPATMFKCAVDGFLATCGLDRGDPAATATVTAGEECSGSSTSGVVYVASSAAGGSGGAFFRVVVPDAGVETRARDALLQAALTDGPAQAQAQARAWAAKVLACAEASKGVLSPEAAVGRAWLAACACATT